MKSLKLNKINRSQLSKEQMNAVTGGGSCSCSCYYAGEPGGSSTTDNGLANWEGGLSSVKGETQMVICCAPQ
ncbi:MAG: TIGR04149 family rSAM-modified RiPP [Bacteroidota bacterium]